MKFLNLVLSVLISGLACSAMANNWYDRGNAGFALFCADQNPVVLDLHENSSRDVGPIQFSKASSPVEKALELVGRLEALDPARALLYRGWVLEFMSSAKFVQQAQINKTPDLGLVTIPTGCALEQVVFQRNPSILNKSRYVVNESLWTQLDADNQAALIVHEVIYREFMNSVALEFSSERIRLFNSILHANLLKNLSKSEYLTLLQELHFTTYEAHGLQFSLGYSLADGRWTNTDISMDDSGNITSGTLTTRQSFQRAHIAYSCADNSTFELGSVQLQNGLLRSLKVQEELLTASSCALPFMTYGATNEPLVLSGEQWTFGPQERPVQVTTRVSGHNKIAFSYKDSSFELVPHLFKNESYTSHYTFDQNLNLVELDLGGHPCRHPSTKKILFVQKSYEATGSVLLDEEGRLTSSLPLCF